MANIKNLKETDIYALSLFTLYKLTEVKEYSLIGELPYIFNKKDLLNFCSYFGGMTIKVPTVAEIKSTMYLILLYQYTKIDGMEFEKAFKKIGYDDGEINSIKKAYDELCLILDKYQFNR